MTTEKNVYGLSEGVFKACQFLGLKFPVEVPDKLKEEFIPSDYFGDDFELDATTIKKLRAEKKWSEEKFDKAYKTFSKKFSSQKPLKKTKTDLNVYFCDYLLFAVKIGADEDNYFDFEFYKKSFEIRAEFRTKRHALLTRTICNDYYSRTLANDKSETNKLFSAFLRRDWLYTRSCTFEEFKIFIEKHPRFFSKTAFGSFGKGAKIIAVNSNENLEQVFATLRNQNRLLEEIVVQHETLSEFCPDTVNTIRLYTILDIHNVVHILATSGRFGRAGGIVDNVRVGGGYSVIIDPKTGIITSDGLSGEHEFVEKHADSGKTFKGFQYPCWKKVCSLVKKASKMIPQLRHIGWDIAVNNKNEPVLIEANGNLPDVGIQQEADGVGRLYLYQPLLDEIKNYKKEQMRLLGYRVNNLSDFDSSYNNPSRNDSRLKFAMEKLIPDCKSLMDLGCRNSKFVKSICPEGVKYFPVDFKKHDEEIIVCDFNDGEFPDIKADSILCAFTAEFVEPLPQFLADMCNAAQKQILMICRPVDKENNANRRWKNPFLTDFTEDFLIKSMAQNNFQLNAKYFASENRSIILYDFRKIN